MIPPFSVEVLGDGTGVAVALVGGLPGALGEVPMLIDGPRVRALAPSRSSVARDPGQPLEPGLPSLATILRRTVE